MGRGRGRGSNRGGRGRGRGFHGGGAPSRAQPPATTAKTERRQCVPTTTDSVSGSESDAPEVLSAKRPPGIEAYEYSSSGVESERRQIANDDDDVPPRSHVPSKSDPCPGGGGVTVIAASPTHPPTVPSANACPKNLSRRAPPQPKKPPHNPFAARTSLLRSVSERNCCHL